MNPAKSFTFPSTSRLIFDKKLLCFKRNLSPKGKEPEWDTTNTTLIFLKKQQSIPRRDLLYRTLRMIVNKEVRTYADLLKFRWDWLIPDGKGQFGTEDSIALTLRRAYMALEEMEKEVKELGFRAPHLQLEVEDRNSQRKSLIKKLEGLGLERKDKSEPKQLSLLDEECSISGVSWRETLGIPE